MSTTFAPTTTRRHTRSTRPASRIRARAAKELTTLARPHTTIPGVDDYVVTPAVLAAASEFFPGYSVSELTEMVTGATAENWAAAGGAKLIGWSYEMGPVSCWGEGRSPRLYAERTGRRVLVSLAG